MNRYVFMIHWVCACLGQDTPTIEAILTAILTIQNQGHESIFATLFNMNPNPTALTTLTDGRIVDVNDAFLLATGHTRERVIGKTGEDLNLWTHPEEREALRQQILKGESCRNKEVDFSTKSGALVSVLLSADIATIDGQPLMLFTAVDMTQRKGAEKTLRQVHEQLQATIKALPDLMFEIDRQGCIHNYYAPQHELLYVQPDRFLGHNVNDVLPVDVCQVIHQALAQAVEQGHCSGATYSLDTPICRKWFELSLAAKGNRHLPESHFIAIVRDITERKRVEDLLTQSLKEKETLLKEIHHRVKNNMQVICSLFNLQTGYINKSNAVALLKESQSRIKSMAMIHETLYSSPELALIDFASYLHRLVDELLTAYRLTPDAIRVAIRVEKVTLGVDKAIPCGLILNELISNSLKYAFPKGQKGEIAIEMKRAQGTYLLRVQDNGTGLPSDVNVENPNSLGLKLVRILTEQINGTVEFVRNPGMTCLIRFQAE